MIPCTTTNAFKKTKRPFPGTMPRNGRSITIPDQESSRNRSTGGSGLGLTISQKIVRRHGGDLAVSNYPEGGALLEGWLPAGGPDQK
ncbi:ATP-binding protein [Paenibacillus chitinolyticus]